MQKPPHCDEERLWAGEFGRAYTARSDIPVHPGRVRFFRDHVLNLRPRSLLEVGCNTGLNLRAIAESGASPLPRLIGVDPEPSGLIRLHDYLPDAPVARASVFALPFSDGAFDLVMTVAVLIHMSLDNLPMALDELYRVSGRYILTHEYFAEEETDIPWQGRSGLLFKRDFLAHWRARYPDLETLDNGFLAEEEGFDRMTFWVLEK